MKGMLRRKSKMVFSKVFIVAQVALAVFLISMAMVMEGAVSVGARKLRSKPASTMAWQVASPKPPMATSFCSNSGKFSFKEWIPAGLKKTSMS